MWQSGSLSHGGAAQPPCTYPAAQSHDVGTACTLLTKWMCAQCVQKCCEKFMKHSTRIGMRFAEFNSQAEAQMAQLMQQQAGK